MVPDYSSCANSKSEANQKSADFLTEARQFLDELAWLNRIRHFPLNASQKHRLPCDARVYVDANGSTVFASIQMLTDSLAPPGASASASFCWRE